MKSAVRILVAGVLVCGSVAAQGPLPVGEQFKVNSYTGLWQSLPRVAVDPQGNFVVTWVDTDIDPSPGTDTSGHSVQAQRFNANGSPVGNQFQVNSFTTSFQTNAEVASGPQGGFVVVYQSWGSSGTDSNLDSILAQRFDASGAPVGGEFQVNSYTTGQQAQGDVTSDAQGNFVVVWESYGSVGSDDSIRSIQGQRYDASGTPLGGQFQVNAYTTYRQQYPQVASDPQGNFVVAWTDTGYWNQYYFSIQARRFDSSGAPIGGDFQVNSHTTSTVLNPSLAVDPQGRFIVVWESTGSYGTDTDSSSVQAQRYDATGSPVGGQFQVNSYTTSSQSPYGVAFGPQGEFVVVWTSDGSYGTDTSYSSVQAQLYDAGGAPLGGQFQVNTLTTSYQQAGGVAMGPDGDFVVVWSPVDIWGQRFAGLQIFIDGFESGDTSAWSNAVP